MKEIMLPYVLIIWLLVKLGVIKWTLKNAVISVGFGAFLAFLLFTAHRFWSPADLTDSTTVKAPHAVLSPLFGQQVKEIHVTHNQKVNKGDLLYTLESEDTDEELKSLRSSLVAAEHRIVSIQEQIAIDKKNHQRLVNLDEFSSEQDRDELYTRIQKGTADLMAARSDVDGIHAKINQKEWLNDRNQVRAPFDGVVGVINIAEGSRTGNLHLFDIDRKFVEMRVSDQTYRHIKEGQFAEFFVNSHPGEIFRGRVHSVTTNTGEAQISPRGATQHVRQHVGNNMGSHGRTIVIEFNEPEGYDIPLGATGSGWVSATKPSQALGFMDIIGGATVRLKALKAYLSAL
ncbi:efflux RND transporter periplasmic adaptor subunit [Vibrio hangzhouensis]|uniref:efflux RND transporter periplasmic adaptor subunit n=1 Tax=Vibrio hangzhouensis TaxID=462991 RepID=UPI001C94550C|nr:efflux RND transporter periplasmic adaptor subunit [Vibrio hangzhouensis]MBY6195965.1 efflux RND transporter periplasmic adaptor subunit [Vibrio hangzhouensis]